MIRHSIKWSELRLYAEESDEAMPDFQAACNMVWESFPDVASISMLKGEMNRKMLRELVQFLADMGVKTIKASRAPGRLLPLFKRVGDHFEMDVREAAEFIARPSRFAAL